VVFIPSPGMPKKFLQYNIVSHGTRCPTNKLQPRRSMIAAAAVDCKPMFYGQLLQS